MIKKLAGNRVVVHLKSGFSNSDNILSGVMIDIDNEYICLQGEDVHSVYVIPKENISYYVSNVVPSGTNKVVKDVCDTGVSEPGNTFNRLDVFVNDEYVVSIPVPPTMNLEQWSNSIMTIVLENPDVRVVIDGKVQKSIEYAPGVVNIKVDDMGINNNAPNVFSMGSLSPVSSFMSPSQMVTRLQNSMRGKHNAQTDLHEVQEADNGQDQDHNISKGDKK